jgi:hypothetical protein
VADTDIVSIQLSLEGSESATPFVHPFFNLNATEKNEYRYIDQTVTSKTVATLLSSYVKLMLC